MIGPAFETQYDVQPGPARTPLIEGNVDDGAVARDQPRKHELGGHERSGQIDPEGLLPALERLVEERGAVTDAGVVDERVDPAEALDHFGDGVGDLLARCDICGSRDRVAAASAQLGRQLLERLHAAANEGDGVSVPGECVGSGPADPGSCSRHDCAARSFLHGG
jgi:hypothetical protein